MPWELTPWEETASIEIGPAGRIASVPPHTSGGQKVEYEVTCDTCLKLVSKVTEYRRLQDFHHDQGYLVKLHVGAPRIVIEPCGHDQGYTARVVPRLPEGMAELINLAKEAIANETTAGL